MTPAEGGIRQGGTAAAVHPSAERKPAALVFTGPKRGAIRRGNFRKLTAWTKTVAEFGLVGLHFHDLRHTGNTLAAISGVSMWT